MLEPVRASYRDGHAASSGSKVYDLADFVYFNHSVHVNKGIGCASCHGRVDKMPLVYQEPSLQMEWCLDCHRQPGEVCPPEARGFNMAWKPAQPGGTGRSW